MQYTSVFAGSMPGPWDSQAACRGAGKVMEETNGRGRHAIRDSAKHNSRAKAICANCPVLEQCRKWVLQHPDPVPGFIAGGLTTRERGTVRRTTGTAQVSLGMVVT